MVPDAVIAEDSSLENGHDAAEVVDRLAIDGRDSLRARRKYVLSSTANSNI